MGLVGSFAGVFVDGRWFVTLVLPMLLGVHRSGALKGLTRRRQAAIYFIAGGSSLLVLWIIGIGVRSLLGNTFPSRPR